MICAASIKPTPSNWRWVSFEEAFADQTRLSKKIKKKDYLTNGKFAVIDQSQKEIAGYTNDESALFLGELPILIFGDHTRVIKYVDTAFACGADGTRVLKPADYLDPEFSYFYLRSIQLENLGYSRHYKLLKKINVPVPSMAEQHGIVSILKRSDSIRRLRKQAQDTARQLIPALFIDMFGDPATNLNGWRIKLLKEVADIGSGVTKGRKLDGNQTIELPYLAVSNVQDGYLNLSKVKSIRIKPTEIEKYKVIPGDFLMTEGGDPDKLGRGAIWNGEIDVCLHQNHIFKVRCKRELLLPEYLKSLVGSRYGKGYFLRVAKQTTGIASINKTQLGKFPVLVPPIELQNDFVARVEGIQSIIGQQEAAQASAESSFQSLLSRAFTGKL